MCDIKQEEEGRIGKKEQNKKKWGKMAGILLILLLFFYFFLKGLLGLYSLLYLSIVRRLSIYMGLYDSYTLFNIPSFYLGSFFVGFVLSIIGQETVGFYPFLLALLFLSAQLSLVRCYSLHGNSVQIPAFSEEDNPCSSLLRMRSLGGRL